ncbi:MAG: peptidoglycan DD-metalloendopeptidase family protein [Parcubacteria group bacterium]
MKRSLLFLICTFILAINVARASMPIASPWIAGDKWRGGYPGDDLDKPSYYHNNRHDGVSEYAIDFNLYWSANAASTLDAGYPIVCVADGTVTFAGWKNGFGNCVEVSHGTYAQAAVTSFQAHFLDGAVIVVKAGEQVRKGQVLGFCGRSGGTSTGDHLHFELRENGRSVVITSMDGYNWCDGASCDGHVLESINSNMFDREFTSNGGSAKFGSYLNEEGTYHGIHWYYGWNANDRFDGYGVPRRCSIQDFIGGSWGRCAIVYDGLGGARRAYTVRTGFWSNAAGTGWSQKGGPRSSLGMPICNEYSTGTGKARQDFIYGYLEYVKGASPDVTLPQPYPEAAPGWIGKWDASLSYLFADCYDRSGRSMSVGDATENVVLGWNGAQYHTQRFSGGTRGNGMIVYDPASSVDSWSSHPGSNRAYYLYGKFYAYWTTVSAVGPWVLGAPTTDRSGTTQYFKYGRMVEVTLSNGNKVVKAYNRDGSWIWTSPQYAGKVVALDNEVEQEDTQETAPVPASFSLHQNYPNPFNAETVIGYELAEAGQVSIDIFNILGQRVISLVDGWQEAGKHTVSWAAYQQSSGVYFYRIQAANRTETKKMVLVK